MSQWSQTFSGKEPSTSGEATFLIVNCNGLRMIGWWHWRSRRCGRLLNRGTHIPLFLVRTRVKPLGRRHSTDARSVATRGLAYRDRSCGGGSRSNRSGRNRRNLCGGRHGTAGNGKKKSNRGHAAQRQSLGQIILISMRSRGLAAHHSHPAGATASALVRLALAPELERAPRSCLDEQEIWKIVAEHTS